MAMGRKLCRDWVVSIELVAGLVLMLGLDECS